MQAGNTEAGWGWVTRAIHWIMAALILFQLGLGLWMTRFVSDLIVRFDLTQIHKSWGFVIFALALVRVVWRLANRRAPGLPAGTPRWQAHVAHVSHAALYLLMLAMPLSGWAMSAASPTQDLLGIRNTVFGWFAMPDPWVPGVKAVEEFAATTHFVGAILLALLLAVHAGAALKHHFVDRDGVLAGMTFGGRTNRRRGASQP